MNNVQFTSTVTRKYRYSHKTLHGKHQRAERHYRVQLPYIDIDCVVLTPPEAKWYFLTTCNTCQHHSYTQTINSAIFKPPCVRVQKGHSHMLRCVAVRAVLQFLPATQVSSRAMKQVAVAGGQQLTHQHHKCIDPHHDQMLT